MERSAEIRDLALRTNEALTQGNVAFVERVVSRQDGAVTIGTDPDEWWEGSARLIEILRAQVEARGAGTLVVVDSDPQAYSEGTVGWVADRQKWRFKDGKEIAARMTAVFHREGGEWKLVQSHFSVGVPNEEMLGIELPT